MEVFKLKRGKKWQSKKIKTYNIKYVSIYCCCCWVASVVSDSVRPHRRQPTRLPRPWDSPGKNTGVGCHFLLQCMKVKSEREVVQSCPTLRTPWTAAHQAPPSMGFCRQEYWSGVPLPSPKYILCYTKRHDIVILISKNLNLKIRTFKIVKDISLW